MNFNYDLATWIEYFIGALACCLGAYFSTLFVLNKKIKEVKIRYYFVLILLSIFTLVNSLFFDNVGKIFGIITVIYIICKYILKQETINSFLYSLVIYIMFILSEITLLMLMTIFDLFFGNISVMTFAKTSIINIVISLLTIIISRLFKNKIKWLVNLLNQNKIFYILMSGFITIFVLIAISYNLYLNKWEINYKFIIDTMVFIGCLVLVFVLLNQYLKNKEINDKYHLLKEYLKTSAELIEKYSTTVHKYKNNLIAIKGYLIDDLNEAEKYIDNLIGVYDNKKYNWFSKINYIQIDAIRYLVYYKLSKAESENLKINVDVSKDVQKYDNNIISIKEANILLEIIGEYFDNAIYASNESDDKELNLIIYNEENNLNIIISNTYKGNVDLSLICKNGYSTKGKNHGLGLYDIDKIVNKNKWIIVKYEKIENYFIANLIIDFNKIKN